MGNAPTKENVLIASQTSESMSFENLESTQELVIRDVYNKLNHVESELQKSNHTILQLNHTIEALTNQVGVLSENIKQTYPPNSRDTSSLDHLSATSFENGIKTLNYIVHTLIDNEGLLMKYIDKLVSIVSLYEERDEEEHGEERDDEDDE